MTNRWRAAMLLAALVGGWQLVGAAPRQADAPLDDRVSAVVKSEMLARGIPSVSVAVMRDGKMLLDRAWGVANIEKNVSATASTTYYIGSNTKQFTAALLLKQVDRGRLALTDPIGKYLTGLSPEVGAVTIEQLLNHTSGLQRSVVTPERRFENVTVETLLTMATGNKLETKPGTTNTYSNAGYAVLGILVEKLYGKKYGAAVHDEIAGPLRLTTLRKCAEPQPGEAPGYSLEPGGKPGPPLGVHHSQSLIESLGGPGPRATPTFHDGTLFALGATGDLRALDASTGKLRWRANILEDADAGNLSWGMAAAPLVVGNTLVTIPGGGNGRSIVAYDRATGRVAWSALDDEAAYSSPMRVKLAGVDQIVVFLATRVVAVSPDRGVLLWEFPWSKQSKAKQPVPVGAHRVFVSTGDGAGGALIEVARDGDRLTAREVWRTHRMKNDFSSSVHHDGFIYGLDNGILACIDAGNGDLKWKGGRYGNGQVLLASGHLVITTDEGDVVLVRETPQVTRKWPKLRRLKAVRGTTRRSPMAFSSCATLPR